MLDCHSSVSFVSPSTLHLHFLREGGDPHPLLPGCCWALSALLLPSLLPLLPSMLLSLLPPSATPLGQGTSIRPSCTYEDTGDKGSAHRAGGMVGWRDCGQQHR
jgi:hypothetical protein